MVLKDLTLGTKLSNASSTRRPTITALVHPHHGPCLATYGGTHFTCVAGTNVQNIDVCISTLGVRYGGYQGPISELRLLIPCASEFATAEGEFVSDCNSACNTSKPPAGEAAAAAGCGGAGGGFSREGASERQEGGNDDGKGSGRNEWRCVEPSIYLYIYICIYI